MRFPSCDTRLARETFWHLLSLAPGKVLPWNQNAIVSPVIHNQQYLIIDQSSWGHSVKWSIVPSCTRAPAWITAPPRCFFRKFSSQNQLFFYNFPCSVCTASLCLKWDLIWHIQVWPSSSVLYSFTWHLFHKVISVLTLKVTVILTYSTFILTFCQQFSRDYPSICSNMKFASVIYDLFWVLMLSPKSGHWVYLP